MNGITTLGGNQFLLTGKNWSGAYKVSLNNIDGLIGIGNDKKKQ